MTPGGFEPPANRLRGDCSTAELRGHGIKSVPPGGFEPPTYSLEGSRSILMSYEGISPTLILSIKALFSKFEAIGL